MGFGIIAVGVLICYFLDDIVSFINEWWWEFIDFWDIKTLKKQDLIDDLIEARWIMFLDKISIKDLWSK